MENAWDIIIEVMCRVKDDYGEPGGVDGDISSDIEANTSSGKEVRRSDFEKPKVNHTWSTTWRTGNANTTFCRKHRSRTSKAPLLRTCKKRGSRSILQSGLLPTFAAWWSQVFSTQMHKWSPLEHEPLRRPQFCKILTGKSNPLRMR